MLATWRLRRSILSCNSSCCSCLISLSTRSSSMSRRDRGSGLVMKSIECGMVGSKVVHYMNHSSLLDLFGLAHDRCWNCQFAGSIKHTRIDYVVCHANYAEFTELELQNVCEVNVETYNH